MQYHFKIHREGKGYWAECLELEGCQSQARTLKELEKNMHEALQLYLDEPQSSSQTFPMPIHELKGKNIRPIPVDPHVAFAVFLRNLRIAHGLTQKQLAQRLQMKGLYSYQRLESPKTANPELKTIAKIKRVFPEISLDEILEP